MRVTLHSMQGDVVHSQEIAKRDYYPDACLYEGRIYIASRMLHGKDGAVYREKEMMQLPEEATINEVVTQEEVVKMQEASKGKA